MFLSLGVSHAQRLRRIILSSVAYVAVPYCSTWSHKRHEFSGGGVRELLNMTCVLFSCSPTERKELQLPPSGA